MRLARRRELTRRRQLGSYYDPYYRVSRYNIKPYRSVPRLGRVITDNVKSRIQSPVLSGSKQKKRIVLDQPSFVKKFKPQVERGYVVSHVRRQVRKIVPGRYLPDCSGRKAYRKNMMKKIAAQVRKSGGQGALSRWRGKLLRKIFC